MVFKIPHRRLFIRTETLFKYFLIWFVIFIIFRTISTIIHKNIRISSWTITLIIKCSWFFSRACTLTLSYWPIISRKMYTWMAHSLFVNTIKSSIIQNDLSISTRSISKIISMFWIKSSLHWCKACVWLTFIWKIHYWLA